MTLRRRVMALETRTPEVQPGPRDPEEELAADLVALAAWERAGWLVLGRRAEVGPACPVEELMRVRSMAALVNCMSVAHAQA